MRTHFKPTETFNKHTRHLIPPSGSEKGFVKGEALRLLRTNSSKKIFEEKISLLIAASWARLPGEANSNDPLKARLHSGDFCRGNTMQVLSRQSCNFKIARVNHWSWTSDHFHHLISHDTRYTCKVHIQEVKTIYTCAVCGVRTCPEPCLHRFHTLQDYYFDDNRYNGPRRMKEGGGRPFQRRRRRSLRN